MDQARPTERFEFTTGMMAGYSHADYRDDAQARVSGAWQQLMEDEYAMHGLYASFVVHAPSRVFYPRDRRCPEGGECVVRVDGVRNPEHNPHPESWRRVVTRVAEGCRRALGQTTGYLVFSTCTLDYLKDPTP